MFSLFPDPPLPPGTQAPDFTLRDQDGREVTLSKLRGRNVVLVFYPRDATPVCTKQLCEFRDESALTASKNTVVFGVNPGGKRSHAGFHGKQRLTFPLLVDERSQVAKLYHARGPLWTLRTVYLIDDSGVIRFAERGKPTPADVLSAARV
jgi:peroxiredoxin Q/BCP